MPRRRSISLPVTLAVGCFVGGVPMQLEAAPISVDNASFESPQVEGNFGNTIDDWNAEAIIQAESGGGMPTSSAGGQENGTQWLLLDSRDQDDKSPSWAFQQIGAVDESLDYTMNLSVGSRGKNPLPADYHGGFFTDDDGDFTGGPDNGAANLDSDAVLAEFTRSDHALANTSVDVVAESVTYDADADGIDHGGEDLYVGFYIPSDPDNNVTNTHQVLFDEVSVTDVPEPASLTMLGLGGVALLPRRRRKG